MRILCRGVGPILLALPLPALAQSAVVTNNVNLRKGPSVNDVKIRTLLPGDELTLIGLGKTNNYYNVRTHAGEVGWAYSPRIHVLDSASAPSPDADSIPILFHGCPLEGSAAHAGRQARNRLKNRRDAPTVAEIDSTITLARVLASGDDEHRWSDSTGAILTGYVLHAKPGGDETANCGDTAEVYRDTHIEVTRNATDTLETQRMIVEVTPRWRALVANRGLAWSTDSLRAHLQGGCARIEGWLFWDEEHADEAENTAPGKELDWRATAWEIHPVTSIEKVACHGP